MDKSSDIPEVDDERLDDNIPEGTDRSRSRDKRIRKCMHPYPPPVESLQNECLPSLLRTGGEVCRQCSPRKSAETGQEIETVEAIYPPNAAQDYQYGAVQRDHMLAAMLLCT